MSVANARCVMVPTPRGKRLRLMPAGELLKLERKGKAKRIGQYLWELVEGAVDAGALPEAGEGQQKAEPNQPPPPPKPNQNVQHPQTQNARKGNNNRHGSRAK